MSEAPFIDLNAPGDWQAEIRRCMWGYEARFVDGLMEVATQPWRPTRRWIERVARRRLARLRRTPETYWLGGKTQ